MAKNALALRMKYRKLSEEQLNEIINNPESDEMEVKIAQEILDKKSGGSETKTEESEEKKVPAKKAPKKVVKKVEEPEEETEEGEKQEEDNIKEDPKKGAKPIGGGRYAYEADPEHELTKEEEKQLREAEKEFKKKQENRKTPSKKDASMNENKKPKKEASIRETKRQNLDESEECPGMKVGSKVCLKGSSTVGEITRIYKSSDGKEKCMVKFGDDKPIKKRVTALDLKK